MRLTESADELVWNLRLAAAMCRLHYRRVPIPLPLAPSVHDLADYWKRYYNTSLGAGTRADFVRNFRLVAGAL